MFPEPRANKFVIYWNLLSAHRTIHPHHTRSHTHTLVWFDRPKNKLRALAHTWFKVSWTGALRRFHSSVDQTLLTKCCKLLTHVTHIDRHNLFSPRRYVSIPLHATPIEQTQRIEREKKTSNGANATITNNENKWLKNENKTIYSFGLFQHNRTTHTHTLLHK